MEEFVSCNIWPLAFGVTFEQVKVGVRPVSKLKVPLPRFAVASEGDEDDIKLLARVETEAMVIVGSYTCPKHKACSTMPNHGRLNHMLELMGSATQFCHLCGGFEEKESGGLLLSPLAFLGLLFSSEVFC
jgi:hypothetical protein